MPYCKKVIYQRQVVKFTYHDSFLQRLAKGGLVFRADLLQVHLAAWHNNSGHNLLLCPFTLSRRAQVSTYWSCTGSILNYSSWCNTVVRQLLPTFYSVFLKQNCTFTGKCKNKMEKSLGLKIATLEEREQHRNYLHGFIQSLGKEQLFVFKALNWNRRRKLNKNPQ